MSEIYEKFVVCGRQTYFFAENAIARAKDKLNGILLFTSFNGWDVVYWFFCCGHTSITYASCVDLSIEIATPETVEKSMLSY